LALYCDRYTPIVALEEADAPKSLLLDITGSSHLFGGEQRLAEKVIADLRQLGYSARVAIADGIGAAWAVAHSTWDRAAIDCRTGLLTRPLPNEHHDPEYSDGSGDPSYGIVVPSGKNRDIVAELGVDVLRLPPDVVHLLHQFDLRCIRQLLELPRGQVAVRFGHETLTRLDQALGVVPEILIPERRAPPVRAIWSFEDPVSHPHVIEKVLERLIRQMVETLTPQQTGVRRLVGVLTTADKNRTEFTVGLLHPTLELGAPAAGMRDSAGGRDDDQGASSGCAARYSSAALVRF
jgi:protein ImuB